MITPDQLRTVLQEHGFEVFNNGGGIYAAADDRRVVAFTHGAAWEIYFRSPTGARPACVRTEQELRSELVIRLPEPFVLRGGRWGTT